MPYLLHHHTTKQSHAGAFKTNFKWHIGCLNKHSLNSLFSSTTRVRWHQEGQTNPDFNEARDTEVAVASAGPQANHLHFSKGKGKR